MSEPTRIAETLMGTRPKICLIKSADLLKFRIFSPISIVALTFYLLVTSISQARAGCPPSPTNFLEDKRLTLGKTIRPKDLVAAQGILSFEDGPVNKIALTSGYWTNNASVFSGPEWSKVTHNNLSMKPKAGLIAGVYEQNGKLWWTSYREKTIFITDLEGKLITRVETPNIKGPVGIAGDPKKGLVFVPSRDENHLLFVFDENAPHKFKTLKIGEMASAPYDIDYHNDCLFLVESNQARIWTLQTQEIYDKLGKSESSGFFGNLFSSNKLHPNVWFQKLVRPQHQAIHKNELYVIDTDDFSVIKIDLSNGTIQKNMLPIQHIFRGLTVTQAGEILLTGFQDIDNISEKRTAIFSMKQN